MDLNTFGEKLVAQLSRIANSAEAIEAAMKGGKVAVAATTPAADAKKPTAAEKKAAADAEAAAKAAASAPKTDRPTLNKALVAVKDTISKEAAQAVYQPFGYTAMSKIEEKDFDAVLAAANKELEDFANKTGAYAADASGADDDL
jgi:hypothetical protein